MDFEGQKYAETVYQNTIIVFGILGWIIGFYQQSFFITFYAVALGTIISLILCLPNWKMFCSNQLKWQPLNVEPTTSPTSTSPKLDSDKKRK
ncbi:hypothetical protein CYY_008680 [Polysphondylium violaceum]|uniref:Signal peptidase complex subunit 1 n=1 Tax=Polysphondylium violaceum TaxID=133409 RepID=A0A8J4PN39_9MYCE|nr:hypothetical protein CYY_008680 [Polysphondylium violaceum]